MSSHPPTRPPTRRRPSRPRSGRALVLAGAFASAVAAGCSTAPGEPSAAGLLVATGGPLRVTVADGTLGAFEAPAEPVAGVAASDGRVVAVGADGRAWTSSGSQTPRVWQPLPLPVAPGAVPLIALSPLGRQLAVAAGDLQADHFDLVVVTVGDGAVRHLAVSRGINGPPAWLDPNTVAMDLIGADGTSSVAAIDATSGVVADRAGPGIEVSATLDGDHLAVLDDTGGAFVGETSAWRAGRLEQLLPLPGPADATAEHVAIDGTGGRVAIVRRAVAGPATIELWVHGARGWTLRRALALDGDGPVGVAWLS
jgi:hypothetical protein